LLSAISSCSFLLRLAALGGLPRPSFLRSPDPGKGSPDPGKKPRQYSQRSWDLQEKNAFSFDFSEHGQNGVSRGDGTGSPSLRPFRVLCKRSLTRQSDGHSLIPVVGSNAPSTRTLQFNHQGTKPPRRGSPETLPSPGQGIQQPHASDRPGLVRGIHRSYEGGGALVSWW
jgi:hypothetical protein